MTSNNIQLDNNGRLKHFLTTEGLSKNLLLEILDHAESFASVAGRAVKKVPLLRGKTIVNLFFVLPTALLIRVFALGFMSCPKISLSLTLKVPVLSSYISMSEQSNLSI